MGQMVGLVRKEKRQMKHIEAAWIEQILTFDSVGEADEYIRKLEASKQRFSIISRDGVRIRIRKQYNKNWFPLKEGE